MGTDIRDEIARGLLVEMPTGAQIVDKNGKVVHEAIGDPDSNKIILQQDWFGSGTSGGDDGGNTNPDTPTAGADYYAGSLADGEITERYLLYQRDESVAEQTNSQTVTLLRDVGSKFNMAGDGATFLIHIQKTAMNAGAKGDVTDIELNYDPNNVAKDGYFTTTSPYPIYTKSTDLATKKTLAIPINGIGENLSGKNVKAPQLNVLFNGDGTMTFESLTGYDNDGDAAGATGANYEVVVDVIATFSVQSAVAQIPPSINFFTGSAIHEIVLSGASDFFENTMNGIKVTLNDHFQTSDDASSYGYSIDSFGISKEVMVPKELLIIGYKYKINSKRLVGYQKTLKKNFGVWADKIDNNNIGETLPDKDYYFVIEKGVINSDTGITVQIGSSTMPDYFKLSVLNITSYTA